MKKDMALTFFVQILVMVAGLYVFRQATTLNGTLGLSEFSLVKRNIAMFQPAFLIGLGVGLPRFLAFATAEDDKERAQLYLVVSTGVVFLSIIILLLFGTTFKEFLSKVLFDSIDYTSYISMMILMVASLLIHAVVYGYYRGTLQMNKANLLQAINLGAIPPISFLFSDNIRDVFYYNGLFVLLISVCVLVVIFYANYGIILMVMRGKKTAVKGILVYSIQRVPSDFGLAALLSIPAILITHRYGVISGGYAAFAFSLLRVGAAFFAPFGLVLLPNVSQLVAKKKMVELSQLTVRLIWSTAGITVAGVFIFYFWGEQILRLYLGEVNVELVYYCKVIIVSAVAYNLYVVLRSVIDAYYEKAVNTLNILIALSAYGCLSGVDVVFDLKINMIFYFVVSMIVLGGLSLFSTNRIFKFENYKRGKIV